MFLDAAEEAAPAPAPEPEVAGPAGAEVDAEEEGGAEDPAAAPSPAAAADEAADGGPGSSEGGGEGGGADAVDPAGKRRDRAERCRAGGDGVPAQICLAAEVAAGNQIVVAFGNAKVLDFVLAWAENCRRAGLTNFLVGATDAAALERLAAAGVPAFPAETDPSKVGPEGGGRWFHAAAFLEWGFDVLVSDVDVAWLRDPFPFFARYPHADILTSSDHPRHEATYRAALGGDEFETLDLLDLLARGRAGGAPADSVLEDPMRAQSSFNIGLIYFRSSADVVQYFRDVLADLARKPRWDQDVFNDFLRRGMFDEGVALYPKHRAEQYAGHREEGRYYLMAYDRKLSLGVLPVSQFCNGNTFFAKKVWRQVRVLPYVVHVTFTESGRVGKRHRLREAKLFADAAAYYRAGDFLVYDVRLPEALTQVAPALERGETPAHHLALVNFQLGLLQGALRAARALDRILVLPPFLCTCETWRYDLLDDCKHAAGDMLLPYLCEADDILQLADVEAATGGRFRESTFLANPRTDPALAASTVRVRLCEGACGAADGAREALLGPVDGDEALRAALAAHRGARVLHFSSVFGLFRGKPRRAPAVNGQWCCQRADPRHQGNVFYEDAHWEAPPELVGAEENVPVETVARHYAREWRRQQERVPSAHPMPAFPFFREGKEGNAGTPPAVCAAEGYRTLVRSAARTPFAAAEWCDGDGDGESGRG